MNDLTHVFSQRIPWDRGFLQRVTDRIEREPVILALGTRTPWGCIAAIQSMNGERYYFMRDNRGDVSMMPGYVVEQAVAKDREALTNASVSLTNDGEQQGRLVTLNFPESSR